MASVEAVKDVKGDTHMTRAQQDLSAIREKQRQDHGDAHDDTEHMYGELAVAAYILICDEIDGWLHPPVWPQFLKDKLKDDRRARLLNAAALLLAEVERVDRANERLGRV